MTPRTAALQIPPENDRYWPVTLAGTGEHHFRVPSYGTTGRLLGLMQAMSGDSAPSGGGAVLTTTANVAGVVLGLCWWHRGLALDTPGPDVLVATDLDLQRYGDRVVDELQEQGYRLPDLVALLEGVAPVLMASVDELQGAQAQADFGQAQEG